MAQKKNQTKRKRATVREGQGSVKLTRDEFFASFRELLNEPAFADLSGESGSVIERAWEVYSDEVDSEAKVPAGAGFKKKSFEVSAEWLATSQELKRLEKEQKDFSKPRRVLLINGSPRSDNTCPSEMSKTHRLCEIARHALEKNSAQVEYLDLSRLASEYGKRIHPCKACVSTAMPLCHWPCSCYPNHKLGQVQDWMAEIYQKWVSAHGIMIVTPVHWYSPPSVLKLMMDRLVCADGGNPDPTTTEWKTPELAKKIELAGWDFPRHLAGRMFAVVVHGDTEGTDTVRRILVDWLSDMGLESAGHSAEIDRYIGYYEPYATSHEDLDKDANLKKEVALAAALLAKSLKDRRRNKTKPLPKKDDPAEVRPK